MNTSAKISDNVDNITSSIREHEVMATKIVESEAKQNSKPVCYLTQSLPNPWPSEIHRI